MAVWYASALMVFFASVLVPRSLETSSLSSITPLAAFLAIAAAGQTLVVMTGGIDLSIPSVITMVGVIIVKVSSGADANLSVALLAALALASAVGLVNGLLVTFFRLNSLVVTLAIGTVVTGGTHWYRGGLLPESEVPRALATWASQKVLMFNHFAFLAIGLIVLFAVALNYTTIGRRFVAAGTNPNAAKQVGIPVQKYQVAAYMVAGLSYGITGVLLAAFVRNPGLDLGNPYMLSTVVSVVLGGALLSGGPASMVATLGAAVFVTLLNHVLRAMGFSTSIQSLTQGIALVGAMAIANAELKHLKWLIPTAIRSRPPGNPEPPKSRPRGRIANRAPASALLDPDRKGGENDL